MQPFSIYVSSTGCPHRFPDNTSADFSNTLMHMLDNLLSYEVCVNACVLWPMPKEPVIILLDIISSSFYNDGKMPILGIYNASTDTVHSAYTPISVNTLSVLKCGLSDMRHKALPSCTEALVEFHFRPKTQSDSR